LNSKRKKMVFLGTMLPWLFFCAQAWAEIKIGFVNPVKILEEAPQAESARGDLEKEFEPRKDKLIAEQKKVQAMEEQLNRDSAIMSDSERRKMERDILTRKRDLGRAQNEFREDLNLRRNDELANLQRQVMDVIRSVAEQEHFDLIVGEGVIYASDAIDITDKIMSKLKQIDKKQPQPKK